MYAYKFIVVESLIDKVFIYGEALFQNICFNEYNTCACNSLLNLKMFFFQVFILIIYHYIYKKI